MLLGAGALAAVAFPWRATWWGGWLLAIGEAGVIGGLADWFAVTALFRRPLGLPIPHTAVIPSNWELLATRVGTMVGSRVLTKEYVREELQRFDLADLITQAASRLTRADLAAATHTVVRWIADQLPASAIREVLARGRHAARHRPLAPALATALEMSRQHGWDQRLIDGLATALLHALERPAFRKTLGDVLDRLLLRYRERLGRYPRLWLGLATLLGVMDRERLLGALQSSLREVAADPSHPLRQHLADAVRELPKRLRTDPDLVARVEAVKAELVEDAVVQQLLDDGAAAVHRALQNDLARSDSEVVTWIVDHLERTRAALLTDEALRRDLDRIVKTRASAFVDRYHARLAGFIEKGVHALGPSGAVRMIEEHAGDDLQYIRVNGTVVGGLAGGALYAVHLLLRML